MHSIGLSDLHNIAWTWMQTDLHILSLNLVAVSMWIIGELWCNGKDKSVETVCFHTAWTSHVTPRPLLNMYSTYILHGINCSHAPFHGRHMCSHLWGTTSVPCTPCVRFTMHCLHPMHTRCACALIMHDHMGPVCVCVCHSADCAARRRWAGTKPCQRSKLCMYHTHRSARSHCHVHGYHGNMKYTARSHYNSLPLARQWDGPYVCTHVVHATVYVYALPAVIHL